METKSWKKATALALLLGVCSTQQFQYRNLNPQGL